MVTSFCEGIEADHTFKCGCEGIINFGIFSCDFYSGILILDECMGEHIATCGCEEVNLLKTGQF